MSFVDIFNTTRKYSIIFADPPWKYGSKATRSGKPGDLDYSSMTTGDICQLPVTNIAADNSVLLLWFTASFVKDAIDVCESWGFNVVRIDQVWNKKTVTGKRHGVTGPWGMSDCEFVLLGSKGRACGLQAYPRNMPTSHDVEYPGVHSRKPDYFYNLADQRFHRLPRVELFARTHRPGWDCWGDEC